MMRFTRSSQSGVSLIELLVGLAISLFLLVGMVVIFIANKKAFLVQGELQRHQENLRMASVLLSTTIRNAGARTDPLSREGHVFSAAAGTPVIAGGAGDSACSSPHSITVSFQAAGELIDCLGAQVGAPGTPDIATNTFTVANGRLLCNGVALVDGVEDLAVRYGVDRDGDGAVEGYLWASDLTQADWDRVLSVQIALLTSSDEEVSPAGPTAINYFTEIGALNAACGGPRVSAADGRARKELTWVVSLNSRVKRQE